MNQNEVEFMFKSATGLQKEMDKIMEKYKENLSKMTDTQKQDVVSLVKDVFTAGVYYGMKISKEL